MRISNLATWSFSIGGYEHLEHEVHVCHFYLKLLVNTENGETDIHVTLQ